MKRIWMLLLALMLILCLCACNQPEAPLEKEFVFPEGTQIAGLDVTGQTREAAWSQLEAAVGSYALELAVDGVPVRLSAADMGLTCSRETFMAGADALEAGTEADFSRVVRFNDGKLRLSLGRSLNKPAKDAAIVYDETAGQYRLEPHTEGLKTDQNTLAPMLKDTIRKLAPSLELNGVSEVLTPAWSADAPEVQAALEQVNRMISVELAYEFSTSETGKAHEIPAETIFSFVGLGSDGFTPSINEDGLDAYVTELGNQYSIASVSGPFRTTGGSTIDLTISYDGLYVDTAALNKDITECLLNGISGTRTAPYLESGARDVAYGGTYIEINLSAQHLWFYKKGELILSTPFVSGCVAKGMCTPTGVYQIYSKSRDLYLTGPTWRDWVSYWMPFYRGYGLHDATWRDTFGDDIYLYEGSHGCINLPLDAAGIIYNNAPVGTRVILYGGQTSVPPRQQELTGTTSWNVADDAAPFQLDIQAKYEDPKLTYVSDNTDVATVSKDGTVTVKGIGTANITVTAAEYSYCTGAEITVTVQVHSACEDGRHSFGEPEILQQPTCTEAGSSQRTCTVCQAETVTEAIPPKEHDYADGTTCRSCGKIKSE